MPDPHAGGVAQAADPHVDLRAELRQLWKGQVPPIITREVVRQQFAHFLGKYPGAVPEVIAMELIRRVDQWDEVTAIQAELWALLKAGATRTEGDPRG